MAAVPLSVETIKLNKECLQNTKINAAIDRGSSLTKFVYVDKKAASGDDILLQCALFHNDNFEAALDWFKEHAELPENGVLKVTGADTVKHDALIQEKLKMKTEFIDEIYAQLKGVKFIIQNGDVEKLSYPIPEIESMEMLKHEAFLAMLEAMKREVHTNEPENFKNEKFPSICGFLGSEFTFAKVNADEKVLFGTTNYFGGRSFLGIAELMLGTMDYKEIMELAAKGDCKNVDTTTSEVLKHDPNSPHGHFPKDLPVFSFGKAVDYSKNKDEFAKQDLAHALLNLIVKNLSTSVVQLCRRSGISRVYLTGNFAQAEIVRKTYYEIVSFFSDGTLDVQFLKTAHFAAIGAMISTAQDVENFFKFNETNE